MESYKSALHAFALEIGGKAKAANMSQEFVEGLLACFGWEDTPGHVDHEIELKTGEKHKAGLWWPERKVLIEVHKPYVMLSMAWPETHKTCLSFKQMPRYVLFTNRREVQLYDTSESQDVPVLSIEVEELAKYSEALSFLTKTWDSKQGLGPILNVATVSKEVAARVGHFYRSLIQGGVEQDEAVRFTLQCITAMFAEDIGLLPDDALTLRLYEAQEGKRTVREVLDELFGQMSTKPTGPREIRYFNGGLFTTPVILDLTDDQLRALTKAAEADWREVDPHIFGSVFQSIMSESERHATGAHYTAREDIMLVVGPTIVEPWRKRIQEAKSLTALKELRDELGKFRVLDPACGSGNFLYVAYREIYRLETELLSRMRKEFPSTDTGPQKVSWVTQVSTKNFFGIDINPFAVELARTTLNIAKKIAFEERKELMLQMYGQVELSTDPSLPLDNLNDNIIKEDALFCEWPKVDAIVGNPPFLGHSKLRSELGGNYLTLLEEKFGIGIVELCSYWFIRAHDLLSSNSRAGLIATSGIRVGRARVSSLGYIVDSGGEITHAVSSTPWKGEAVVNVSVVNWIKGSSDELKYLTIDGLIHELKKISSHLRLVKDTSNSSKINANKKGISEGVKFANKAFYLPEDITLDVDDLEFISPAASGQSMLTKSLADSDYCVDFKLCLSEDDAKESSSVLYEYLKDKLLPVITKRANKEKKDKELGKRSVSSYTNWLKSWWLPYRGALDFFRNQLEGKLRIIVCASVSARPIFCVISSQFLPTNTMHMFAFDDDYSFGIIQSTYHWEWTKALGGRLAERIRYTTKVWKTFPWPQAPTEQQVLIIAQAARDLRAKRDELMAENDWNLRQLYQTAEKVGENHPLNQAQAALDAAVKEAYGHPGDQGIVEFLLELNGYVAQDEKDGYEVQGPGIPVCMDPDDPRLMSEDCIMPPPLPITDSEVSS